MAEKLLTVREAADRMRVTTQTIYNWVKAGTLPVVRVGRTIRIDPKDLPEAKVANHDRDRLAGALAQVADAAEALGLSPIELLEAMMSHRETSRTG